MLKIKIKVNMLENLYYIISNPTNIKVRNKIVKNSDYIICDSRITEKYIKSKYDTKMSYIPYAADVDDVKTIDKETKSLMEKYDINPREY